jgi:hypothetical protein
MLLMELTLGHLERSCSPILDNVAKELPRGDSGRLSCAPRHGSRADFAVQPRRGGNESTIEHEAK